MFRFKSRVDMCDVLTCAYFGIAASACVCVLANESVVAVKSCGLSRFLNRSPLAPTPRLHAELAPWRRVNRNPVHHALGGGLAAAPSK